MLYQNDGRIIGGKNIKGDGMMKRLFSNRDLTKLIIPLIIEQFLLIFVGLADSVMVASVGEEAVSAVSLIDSVMILLINAFTALATGGAIVAGQAIGRGEPEDGCWVVDQLALFISVFSVLIMALLYLGKPFVLHVVFGNIDQAVMENCNIYLLIVAASIPFIALYNAGAAIYRAMGDSKTPMLMSLLMNGLNLAGNALLIYGMGMGIEGAAIPTLVSRVSAGIVMLRLLLNKKKTLHMTRLWGIRFDGRILKKVLSIGIPYGLENSMFQLGKILVLSLVATFGTVSIAANAVSNSVCTFAVLTGLATGYALSSVTAQCVGAGDMEQVRYYTKKIMAVAYVSMFLMNVSIVLLLPAIMRVYNLSPETARLASGIIIYHAVCAVLIWPASFTLSNTLRAANDAGYCMIVSVLSMWIFRIGFSYILADYFQMGVFGIWIAMTIDWSVRAVFFVVRYIRGKWQVIKS